MLFILLSLSILAIKLDAALIIPYHTEYLCTWKNDDYYHQVPNSDSGSLLKWNQSEFSENCSVTNYVAHCLSKPLTAMKLKATNQLTNRWYLYHNLPIIPGTYHSIYHHPLIKTDSLCIPKHKSLRLKKFTLLHKKVTRPLIRMKKDL